jgi:N-acetylneuraminic acid mutarotase
MRNLWKSLLLSAALLASLPVSAHELMVYMHENGGAKQIVLSNADGTNPHEITSGASWHLYPDITPAGDRVAFVEGSNEKGLNIVTLDIKSKQLEQWTTGEGMRIHPKFSVDGRYLVFSGPYGPGGRAQIAILDLKETRETAPKVWVPEGGEGKPGNGRWIYSVKPEVIPSDYPCYFPSFTADASTVLFQRSKSKTEKDLVAYDLAEKTATVLTPGDTNSMKPALSFDNRWLAYTSFKNGQWNIYLADRMGKDIFQVTKTPAHNFAPTFRPDGSLVFASDREGHFLLYEIPAEEMAARTFKDKLLVKGEGDYYAPSVSGEVRVMQRILPEISEPARSSFGAVRLGNRIYVSGGHQGHEHTYPPESFLSKVEYFDLSTQTWHEVASRPAPCHGYGIAGAGKYLYAFGGFAYSKEHKPSWKSLDVIDRYDTEKNVWTRLKVKLSVPRSSNVVAQLGDKVYLLAGWDSTPKKPGDMEGRFLDTIEVFDLKTEQVTLLDTRVPAPLRRALSGVVMGDEIILVGGLGQGASHFELLDNVTAFKPSTGTWRELPRLPFATFAPATGVIGNQLFVFGGMFRLGKMEFDYVSHIFSLKPGAPRWTHVGRYLSGKKGFSMVVPLSDTTVGILGGHTYAGGSDGPVRTFEAFGLAPVSEETLLTDEP